MFFPAVIALRNATTTTTATRSPTMTPTTTMGNNSELLTNASIRESREIQCLPVRQTFAARGLDGAQVPRRAINGKWSTLFPTEIFSYLYSGNLITSAEFRPRGDKNGQELYCEFNDANENPTQSCFIRCFAQVFFYWTTPFLIAISLVDFFSTLIHCSFLLNRMKKRMNFTVI